MQVIKRARAKIDLVDIWRYTFETWGEAQADAYIAKMESALARIADHPFIGIDCGWLMSGVRRFNAGHHLIFYRVHDDWIELVRVLHQSMDPDGKL